MKEHCFVDEQGRVYKTESLQKAASNLPIEDYEIDPEKILSELLHW